MAAKASRLMRRFSATWQWKLESPLHCGSGISRPGFADRLVYRDQDNRIVIPGEAVKGALRMSAEQLVAWMLGVPQRTGPPRPGPLAHIFGGSSGAHFTLAKPGAEEPDEPEKSMVRASTSINRATGTAEQQTLRAVEVLAPNGSILEASFWADIPDQDYDAVETLFVAALCATEAIGARVGVGWGRVSLASLRVNHEAANGEAVINSARLESLKKSLLNPVVAAAATEVGSESTATRPSVWYKLKIDLDEPACFPIKPEISNKVETERAISATTLRGAFAAYWLRGGVRPALVSQRLSTSSKWLPAFPVFEGQRCAPAPRSLLVDKREASPAGREPVVDGIGDRVLPERADGSRRKLQPTSNAWVYVRNGTPRFLPVDGLTATRMHVARDYVTGSKKNGALYARESLLPPRKARNNVPSVGPTHYVAFALLPDDVWQDAATEDGHPFEVQLGKRKSAGNGLAYVTAFRENGPPSFPSRPGEKNSPDVYVELLTPAIVRDQYGYPLRSLSPSYWEEQLQAKLPVPVTFKREARAAKNEISQRSTAAGKRGGWMSTWNQPRAAVTTIDAGSCWRLRCKDAVEAVVVRAALRTLQQIGDRRHEGFGWIVVDPPWSGYVRPSDAPADTAPERTMPEPLPWPGCGSESRAELDRIVAEINQEFPKADALEGARAALQQLAIRARDEDCNAVRALCARMADALDAQGRPKTREGWKLLSSGTGARRLLDSCWTAPNVQPERLRFVLDALLVRASGSGGTR